MRYFIITCNLNSLVFTEIPARTSRALQDTVVPVCRQIATHGTVKVYCDRRRLRVGNFAAQTLRGLIPLSFDYVALFRIYLISHRAIPRGFHWSITIPRPVASSNESRIDFIADTRFIWTIEQLSRDKRRRHLESVQIGVHKFVLKVVPAFS